MRLLHNTQRGSRRIQLFTRGIRRVVLGDSESWATYLIIPRAALLAGIRARRVSGAQLHDCDWWKLIPGIDAWVSPAGYSGPGRSFARAPVQIKSSRRFLVIAQSGGLDV